MRWALGCRPCSSSRWPRRRLSSALRIIAVLALAAGVCLAAGYLVGWWLRLGRRSLDAFVQGAFCGNLTSVGLPVVLDALHATGNGSQNYHQSLALLASSILAFSTLLAMLALTLVLLAMGCLSISRTCHRT